jgi:hypothetical protein
MSRFINGFIHIRLAPALLCAGLILLLLPSGSIAARRSQKALPRLVIDSTKKDFGEVYAGEELEHVFTVRNEGDAPLELSQTPLLTGESVGSPTGLIRAVSFVSPFTSTAPAMHAAPS